MKLYYSKGACSLAIRIIIHEIGIHCDYESVNLKTKITESQADYWKINAKGAVPALLLDNHELLTENCVIQQYLTDTHKATQLLPPIGDFKRFQVLEWLNFVSTDLHKSCGPLFNPNVPDDLKQSVFVPTLKTKLRFADDRLSQQSFLMGDHFTLPDSYLFVVLRWLPNLKIDLAEFPNLSRFMSNLKGRDSIKRSLQEEGIA